METTIERIAKIVEGWNKSEYGDVDAIIAIMDSLQSAGYKFSEVR